MKHLLSLLGLIAIVQYAQAQCAAGTTLVTWQGASTGTQTVVPSFSTAGGPPAAINDTSVGCTTNNIFTLSISDPNSVYDRIRSGTSGTSLGTYGTPFYTITMDNLDGGCGSGALVNPTGGCTGTQNAAYAAGNKIIITFTFQQPVLMSGFRIDDIDASDISQPPAGSSSFQDQVVFSALSATGANVPIALSVGASGIVNISGQTATAIWAAGVNNNVSPDDARGQVTASTSAPIKSFTMEYVAGPNETNPAQQAIRLGQFNVCCPNLVNLSGRVFNDVNGLTDNTVNGTGLGNPAATPLYANLTDPVTGKVVAVVPVNADGTYNFTNVVGQSNYNLILSTTQGTLGAAAPSPSLPAGWANTGENIGTAAGNDGAANGVLPISVASANITNANFGIERLPSAGTATAPSTINPGGNSFATVSAATFNGTDPDAGIITSLRITAFPSNANSITINGTVYCNTPATGGCVGTAFPAGGVTVPTNSTGQPTQAITVDPIDGATTVTIPYKTIDNANKESINTGAANIPFTTIGLSGTVFNDVNGLNDNTVNGTGIGNPGSTSLYANLISAGVVVATVPVNANGTYDFPIVNPNTSYTVQVTTNQGTVGAVAPATALPNNWVSTGENIGTAAGNDGPANAQIAVTTGISSISNVDFGIEQLPNSGVNVQPTQNNPGGTTFITVPASAFTSTDPDGGTIAAIRITAFPTDVTTIRINGVSYTNLAGIQAAYPNGIPTNASGQPTVTIEIDPANGANRTAVIPFAAIDNAGKEDATPGSVTLPFTNSFTVNGNLFNDIGGLVTNSDVDGDGIGSPSGTQVYAYLVDNSGNVVQRVAVNSNGSYSFANVTAATYSVRMSTILVNPAAPAPAVALPTNWVVTGENIGLTSNDLTANGISNTFTVSTADVFNVNFGIEQLPNSGVNTQPAQVNPGTTVSVPVPASAFSGTDPDAGIITAIRITAFPTNAESITINGTSYTTLAAIQTAYPNGIPTNASGEPTQAILINPVDGNVTSVISYATIDNAGKEDPTPGSVSMPFFSINLSGNVYNDVNGLTNSTVDGASISGITLYANLLDATGTTVIATVPVTSGAYNFTNIPGNTDYIVQLSTNQGVAGQPAPAVALPTNWVNTGENLGTGAGSDGTVNGLLPVAVAGINVNNANFAIQQLPNTGTFTTASQANPGGSNSAVVPSSAFSGTDPDGGNISAIRITALPSNATSITINGTTYTVANFPAAGITVPTNAAGEPTQAISVDPLDGTVNVVISYAAIDNAGKEDLTPGSVTMPFSNISFAGNVFNDGNGLNGSGNVDGNGIGVLNGTQLYANLLNAAGTQVVATVPVNTDGTYSFFGVTPGVGYQVQLSANAGTVSAAPPATSLPNGWQNTGEDCCDNSGSDGTINGLVTVPTVTADVTNINFGLNSLPESENITAVPQINPGGTIQAPVPALVGTDLESGNLGSGNTVRIDVIPNPTTQGILYYDADGPGGAAPVAVTAGQVINNYNPAYLTVDPMASDATQPNVLVTFQYSVQDGAGAFDPTPSTVQLQFLQPVAIKGTVWNDVNGSAAGGLTGIQNGIETGTNAYDGLYAYLRDVRPSSPTFGQIIRKVAVAADGTYEFDGLSVIGDVEIYISTNSSIAVGSTTIPSTTPPAGWGNTSPLVRTVNYNNPAGLLVSNQDFGIQQAPESFDYTGAPQANPGGTNSATVPATAFNGEDVAIGNVAAIQLTSFPTNATSITIDGVMYTTLAAINAAYPNGIPTNNFGNPTVPIAVDPIDGNVVVSITFVAIDNAGSPDLTAALVNLPFNIVLSVNSIELAATYVDNNARLTWVAIDERDVDSHTLEYSINGTDYKELATTLSQGNGNYNYNFNHNLVNVNSSVLYYRVKVNNANGTVQYSNIVKLFVSKVEKLIVTPNPFTDYVSVQLNASSNQVIFMCLLTADGKQVASKQVKVVKGNNSFVWNGLGNLAKAIYVIQATTAAGTTNFTLLKR
jgi:hypothetical protein